MCVYFFFSQLNDFPSLIVYSLTVFVIGDGASSSMALPIVSTYLCQNLGRTSTIHTQGKNTELVVCSEGLVRVERTLIQASFSFFVFSPGANLHYFKGFESRVEAWRSFAELDTVFAQSGHKNTTASKEQIIEHRHTLLGRDGSD